ncbi:MAG: type II toxin-antitoxin system VapC family toxin [Chloroflexota bacterium]|nr:type II toxin-antitoxin system VapC family toxin [Chloroflexota bacterium]
MNSLVCVDADIIIWALLPFPLSDQAEALLARWRREEKTLIAPALFAFEVTSTLRRLVHLREITPEQGETAFEQFLKINVRLSHRRAIFPLAWQLAKQYNRPRAYDTAYLALAQLRGCEFWTTDQRLYNAVRHDLTWVNWIGDFSREAISEDR